MKCFDIAFVFVISIYCNEFYSL